ncbi:MAG: hypothetical protein ABIJ61_14855 [bacterium]
MTATQFKLAILGLLALALFVVQGCSNDVTEAETTDDVLNLTDTYGGYQPTSESPGFGDPELLSLEESEPADDPMANSPLVDSLYRMFQRDVYSVELLWGNLQYDSTATMLTDWSGSLSVERGAVVAARLIQFEADDHLIRPRPNGQTLEWASQTSVHYDGILVFVYDPQPDSFPTENTLTLTTAPCSRTFTLSELASLSEIVEVGDDEVSINAFQTTPLDCGEGFMAGRWIRLPNERGTFQGHWISRDGYALGHVRGHFGIDASGENVLFGKWIGIGGGFRGLLRGTWGYESAVEVDSAASGWFNGRWDNAAGTRLGDFGGNWVALQPPLGDGTGNANGNGNGDGVCDSTGIGGTNGDGICDGSGSQDRPHPVGHGAFRGQWQEICEDTE